MEDVKVKDLNASMKNKKVVLKGEIKTTEKVASNGSKFISVSINDGTGEIWDNIFVDKNKELYEQLKDLDNSKRYRIVGKIRSVKTGSDGFNGINMDTIEETETKIVKKITTKSEKTIAFKQIFEKIEDKRYRSLVNCIYKTIDLNVLYKIPASENHYTYEGGLADHIIRVSKILGSIIDSYEGRLNFNKDLLLTACLLFRVGKVRTLKFNNGKAILTEEGVLFDDSSITHDIVSKSLNANGDLSELEKLCLLHTIDSSKYKPEFGALTEPKTKEAYLLYYSEMISLNEAKFAHLNENNLNEDNNIVMASKNRSYFLTENIKKED